MWDEFLEILIMKILELSEKIEIHIISDSNNLSKHENTNESNINDSLHDSTDNLQCEECSVLEMQEKPIEHIKENIDFEIKSASLFQQPESSSKKSRHLYKIDA